MVVSHGGNDACKPGFVSFFHASTNKLSTYDCSVPLLHAKILYYAYAGSGAASAIVALCYLVLTFVQIILLKPPQTNPNTIPIATIPNQIPNPNTSPNPNHTLNPNSHPNQVQNPNSNHNHNHTSDPTSNPNPNGEKLPNIITNEGPKVNPIANPEPIHTMKSNAFNHHRARTSIIFFLKHYHVWYLISVVFSTGSLPIAIFTFREQYIGVDRWPTIVGNIHWLVGLFILRLSLNAVLKAADSVMFGRKRAEFQRLYNKITQVMVGFHLVALAAYIACAVHPEYFFHVLAIGWNLNVACVFPIVTIIANRNVVTAYQLAATATKDQEKIKQFLRSASITKYGGVIILFQGIGVMIATILTYTEQLSPELAFPIEGLLVTPISVIYSFLLGESLRRRVRTYCSKQNKVEPEKLDSSYNSEAVSILICS